jgi:hypothetical protein
MPVSALEKQCHAESTFAMLPETPLESLAWKFGERFRTTLPLITRFLAGEPLISESDVRDLITDAAERIFALAQDCRDHEVLGPFISKVENSLEEWMRSTPYGEKLLEVRMLLGPLFGSENIIQSNDSLVPQGAVTNHSRLFKRLEDPRESSRVLYLVNFVELPELIDRVVRLGILTIRPESPQGPRPTCLLAQEFEGFTID